MKLKKGWLCAVLVLALAALPLSGCTGGEPKDEGAKEGPTYPPSSCTHMTVVDDPVSPTCTEKGLTTGSHCIGCGTIFEAQREIPPLGHDFKDGVCTRCAAVEPGAE